MTREEYKEFTEYKCPHDCEHCEYHAWLGYDWGCIADICNPADTVHDEWDW